MKFSHLHVTVPYSTLILSSMSHGNIQFVFWFPATFLDPQRITSSTSLLWSILSWGGVEIRSRKAAGWRLAPEHYGKRMACHRLQPVLAGKWLIFHQRNFKENIMTGWCQRNRWRQELWVWMVWLVAWAAGMIDWHRSREASPAF